MKRWRRRQWRSTATLKRPLSCNCRDRALLFQTSPRSRRFIGNQEKNYKKKREILGYITKTNCANSCTAKVAKREGRGWRSVAANQPRFVFPSFSVCLGYYCSTHQCHLLSRARGPRLFVSAFVDRDDPLQLNMTRHTP